VSALLTKKLTEASGGGEVEMQVREEHASAALEACRQIRWQFSILFPIPRTCCPSGESIRQRGLCEDE